jgi:hypothetical protein
MHQHSNHCKVSQKIDWCKCRAVVPNAQRSLLRTGRAAALPLQPALLYDLHDELVPYEQVCVLKLQQWLPRIIYHAAQQTVLAGACAAHRHGSGNVAGCLSWLLQQLARLVPQQMRAILCFFCRYIDFLCVLSRSRPKHAVFLLAPASSLLLHHGPLLLHYRPLPQHPPVYTLGAGSSEEHLRFDPADPPHPLHRTERGGEVTYHGPGQASSRLSKQLTEPPLHACMCLRTLALAYFVFFHVCS